MIVTSFALGTAAVCVLIHGQAQTQRWIVAALVLAGVVTLRPGIIGEGAGPVGALPFAALLLFVLRDSFDGTYPPRWTRLALAASVAIPLIRIGTFNPTTVVGAVIVMPIAAATGWAVGRRPRVLDAFVGLVALLAAQQAVAHIAASVVDATSRLVVAGRGYGYLISPFGSISAGSGGVFPIIDGRLTGPFGEPGVFAMFLSIVAALDLGLSGRFALRRQGPMAAAILLTQSVAGVGGYLTATAVFALLRTRRWRDRRFRLRHYVIAAGAATASVWAATRPEGILDFKKEANAASVSDRLAGVGPVEMVQGWIEHPLGHDVLSANATINLLQSAASFGPLVLVAGIVFYAAPFRTAKWQSVAPATIATLLCITFSQPPMLYSWVFLSFATAAMGSLDQPTTRSDARPQRYVPSALPNTN